MTPRYVREIHFRKDGEKAVCMYAVGWLPGLVRFSKDWALVAITFSVKNKANVSTVQLAAGARGRSGSSRFLKNCLLVFMLLLIL